MTLVFQTEKVGAMFIEFFITKFDFLTKFEAIFNFDDLIVKSMATKFLELFQ